MWKNIRYIELRIYAHKSDSMQSLLVIVIAKKVLPKFLREYSKIIPRVWKVSINKIAPWNDMQAR